jgi:hypothetical protein
MMRVLLSLRLICSTSSIVRSIPVHPGRQSLLLMLWYGGVLVLLNLATGEVCISMLVSVLLSFTLNVLGGGM